jgi:hypothetical protein
MLDVLHNTPSLFNSVHGKGRGTDGVGIECYIGGANGHQAFNLRTQPDDATMAKIGVGGHRDVRQGPPTQWMTRISDRDGLLCG